MVDFLLGSPSARRTSRAPTRLAVLAVCQSLLGAAATARADQFAAVDVSHTITVDDLGSTNQQYQVPVSAGIPSNWTTPINYSAGSLYVILLVNSTPGTASTRLQVCLQAAMTNACTTSPAYTAPGVFEWALPFSGLALSGEVDWTQGIQTVSLALLDATSLEAQSSSDFVPTDVRVQVNVISPGSSFQIADGGITDDARGDAGTTSSSDGGTHVDQSGGSAVGGASSSTGDAGPTKLPSESNPLGTTSPSKPAGSDSDSGCSVRAPGLGFDADFSWALIGLGLLAARRLGLERRRPRSSRTPASARLR